MSEDIKKSNLVAPEGQTPLAKKYGLLIALAVLVAVLLMPMPAGLSVAGHRMLAILLFAVITWTRKPLRILSAPRSSLL